MRSIAVAKLRSIILILRRSTTDSRLARLQPLQSFISPCNQTLVPRSDRVSGFDMRTNATSAVDCGVQTVGGYSLPVFSLFVRAGLTFLLQLMQFYFLQSRRNFSTLAIKHLGLAINRKWKLCVVHICKRIWKLFKVIKLLVVTQEESDTLSGTMYDYDRDMVGYCRPFIDSQIAELHRLAVMWCLSVST